MKNNLINFTQLSNAPGFWRSLFKVSNLSGMHIWMSYFVSDNLMSHNRLKRHPLYWMPASNPSFKWELIFSSMMQNKKIWEWKLGVSFFWCWIKREAIFKHKYSWIEKRAQFWLKSKTQWTISCAVRVQRFKWKSTIFSWKLFFGTPCKYPLHYKWCQVGYFCPSIILRGTNLDEKGLVQVFNDLALWNIYYKIELEVNDMRQCEEHYRGFWFHSVYCAIFHFLSVRSSDCLSQAWHFNFPR